MALDRRKRVKPSLELFLWAACNRVPLAYYAQNAVGVMVGYFELVVHEHDMRHWFPIYELHLHLFQRLKLFLI